MTRIRKIVFVLFAAVLAGGLASAPANADTDGGPQIESLRFSGHGTPNADYLVEASQGTNSLDLLNGWELKATFTEGTSSAQVTVNGVARRTVNLNWPSTTMYFLATENFFGPTGRHVIEIQAFSERYGMGEAGPVKTYILDVYQTHYVPWNNPLPQQDNSFLWDASPVVQPSWISIF